MNCIESLDPTVDALRGRIECLLFEKKACNSQIDDLSAKNNICNHKINELSTEIDILNLRIVELEQDKVKLEQDKVELNQAFVNSTSWKLTEPLRKLYKTLKSIRDYFKPSSIEASSNSESQSVQHGSVDCLNSFCECEIIETPPDQKKNSLETSPRPKKHLPSPKRVLFVLYGSYSSNSGYHVSSLAKELASLGNDIIIATSRAEDVTYNQKNPPYKIFSFSEIEKLLLFNPDVIHYWTPREVNRNFSKKLNSLNSRMVIHMEDNELLLTKNHLGIVEDSHLASLTKDELDSVIKPFMSHPIRCKEFLDSADGYTMLIDDLKNFVDTTKPACVFWPAADENLFCNNEHDIYLNRLKYGIKPTEIVVVYNGNVHSSNHAEVQSLYLAVALLNDDGVPTKLIRTGLNERDFWRENKARFDQYEVGLGYVERSEMSTILSIADVFIQPGRDDEFNKYRFPSKLPEFLLYGKPTILPKSNIGNYMTHKKDAYVLEVADAENIVEAVKDIMSDEDLYDTLSTGAQTFYEKNFSWEKSAEKIVNFYHKL